MRGGGIASNMPWWLQVSSIIFAHILALVRVYEFVRDRRPKLSLTPLLTSDSDMGNTLLLLNSSKVPANIYSYSLVWVKAGVFSAYTPFLSKVVREEFPLEAEFSNMTVPAHSQYQLLFRELDWFEWGCKLKYELYLKVRIVGRRRPLWLWVTGPIQ